MSNLLKQCFIVNAGEKTRIIDSNERLIQSWNENRDFSQTQQQETATSEKSESEESEAFSSGIQSAEIDVESIRMETIESAKAEAEQMMANAKEKADKLVRDAKKQAKDLLEEHKKRGYEEGAREKEAELEAEKSAVEEKLAAHKQQLSDLYDQKLAGMECDIIDAVIQVFDKVFHIQFEDKREILFALVNNVLMEVDTDETIRIHVNDADRKMLEQHLPQLQETAGQSVSIEFVRDIRFKDGQCQIETSYGVFDCGIDTQLTNLFKDIRALV